MIVNQANLHGLGVGFSTAFNMGFENTGTTWDKVATRVPEFHEGAGICLVRSVSTDA